PAWRRRLRQRQRLWRAQRRRQRVLPRPARDVLRDLLRVRPDGPGAVPASLGQAGLLLELLRAAAQLSLAPAAAVDWRGRTRRPRQSVFPALSRVPVIPASQRLARRARWRRLSAQLPRMPPSLTRSTAWPERP